MEIYQVGGAVRDQLLGLPVQDRDWVVVGATAEQMKAMGYRPVGKDFPVFLHPDTHEEYALARTERKTGPGYKGFHFHAAPDVTLAEDLRRRDLTINAMAMAADGRLIDPYGGAADLRQRLLHHVSPAFSEDPVRILRVARFAARFVDLGFQLADETLQLMRDMVSSGEVDALVPERVWAELQRALGEARPSQFFEVLRASGALARLLPELDALFGVPQPREHHPEIDTGVHVLQVVDQAATLSPLAPVRFAALLHDLGKGTTPREEWPRHHNHEQRGTELVRAVCGRLRVPNEYRDLALLVAAHHGVCHRALELRPATALDLLEKLDALRRPERFEQFLLACQADSTGRPGYEQRAYPQADLLRRALATANHVDSASLAAQGLQGLELGAALRQARLTALKQLMNSTDPADH